jgi:hypothetical protein
MGDRWVDHQTWACSQGFRFWARLGEERLRELHRWPASVKHTWCELHEQKHVLQHDADYTRAWVTNSGGDLVSPVFATRARDGIIKYGIPQHVEVNLNTAGVSQSLTHDDTLEHYFEPGG